ncbi:MAG TPA: AAA family ATPase, partial [bacterium]|nr:AAA family ATPase [bacterium]
MNASVTNEQRYSTREDRPCPICGGGADDPRSAGVRCIGFVSGSWARCSRTDTGRPPGDDGTYVHRLLYGCACGKTHSAPTWWKSRVTKFNYVDNDLVVGTHGRRDWPIGPKDMWWEGLNGRAPATLPFYGTSALAGLPKRSTVVLTEGEKKADRLLALNIPAVATGTGAPGTHEADAFKALLDFNVILWGDDDEKGRQQRRANADRLREIGHPNVTEMVDGTPAPDDYLRSDTLAGEVLVFLDQAVPIGGARSVGQGLGTFLTESANLRPIEEYIDGLLSSEGSGWIGGEEKLGKSYYMIHEALCLALRLPVLGKFTVPVRRRVLVIEEEDPPRRVRDRVRGLLRGLDLDPDDQAVRDDLDQWFLIQVWGGFTLDDAGWRAKLDQTIQTFKPDVIYLDAVRKVTALNLSRGEEAQTFLDRLDVPRRKYGAIFRVLHHYRKVGGGGGFRSGRGSQEIAGSNKLGAWGED